MLLASVKSFYWKRNQHRFLSDTVNQIQDDDQESANVAIIGPPTGGQDTDLKNEDDTINATGLPEEIAGGVKVFNIRNDEIGKMTSDGEDSDVEPSMVKKQKQNVNYFVWESSLFFHWVTSSWDQSICQ